MARLEILPPDDLLEAIDEWRRGQTPIPSRAAAVRALVSHGIATWGKPDIVPAAQDRIDLVGGSIDDVVINGVTTFRMEWLGVGAVWLRCYRDGQPDVVFRLASKSAIVGKHEME